MVSSKQLDELLFARFWYYFSGVLFNVAATKSDYVRQDDIVRHFEQKGYGNAFDITKNMLKARHLGNEIPIINFYCLYPALSESMSGKRRKTTMSVWSDEEEEIDMLTQFLQLFNRRGKYKEKYARRTLKEFYNKINNSSNPLSQSELM